ncbi:LysR family transcriptional regulator [Thioclava sp. BHET1]|nr:LysR family transcriptional regulator [Thioclava sp. BHET1]
MHWPALPPLSALRAFAAFADTGSVTEAGARLNVSHAAISQQLRALEAHLGLSLVDRSGRGLSLTAEGARLADAALAGFSTIARVVEQMTQADRDRPVQITTTASFAAGWLMPRLADFRARHPSIDLMVDASAGVRSLGEGGIDLALRHGRGDWPGVVSEWVLRSPVVLVGAPQIMPEGGVSDLDSLADVPWLQEWGTSEVSGFLERHGVQRRLTHGLISLPGNLILEAVRAGQGLAVMSRHYVEPDIAAGRLCVLYADAEREGYFLVTPPGGLRPAARLFAAWVRKQAAVEEKAAAEELINITKM